MPSRLRALAALLLAPILSAQATDRLHLRYATFDPVEGEPTIAADLRSDLAATRLWIVQFAGTPRERTRDAIRATGAVVHGYLPRDAHVVRMAPDATDRIRALGDVRWVGAYHPAYRLEPALLAEHSNGRIDTRRYNIVVVDKRSDKPGLVARIRAIGGRVDHEHPGSLLLQAELDHAQLLATARMDEVLWIDRWSPGEIDMNNARAQSGADSIETAGGFTGQGIRGHIYEGMEATHADFTIPATNVGSAGNLDRHGHCTAGIIAGNGTSHSDARGIAPGVQMFFTDRGSVNPGLSRYQVVQDLVRKNRVMFTSASWGGFVGTSYTSESADADDIIFDHDIPWTQSQSNTGTTLSRPQAWAKNVFAIGGIEHFNNSDPSDDSWQAGGASIGPAQDGRIKPDLCAYYDLIHCSDLTGPAGYTSTNSYTNFGGTSGATPIVAGCNALAIEMFTDGIFGNGLRVPGGTRFENRPHFTTLKALQVANASQYSFDESSTDNRREHQGWGFPGLRSMWDNRDLHVIIDETDVLAQGEGTRWEIDVPAGRTELKISMAYADPAANPASVTAAVNDLSLRVTSPSGTLYWGNHGLDRGTASLPGGVANEVDTVENLFVPAPEAGRWRVDVLATRVAQDSHVETASVDADYALVVNGATLVGSSPVTAGAQADFGLPCPGSFRPVTGSCLLLNPTPPLVQNTFLGTLEWSVEVPVPFDMTMVGFRIRSRATTPTTIQTTVREPDRFFGRPGNVIANGTMRIETAERFYETTFAAPLDVAAGSTIFLGISAPFLATVAQPIVIAGEMANVYVLRPGSPVGSPRGYAWAYQVSCLGTAAPPRLDAQGLPALGANYDVSLSTAAPNAPAALMVGLSNTSWPLGALPFDLGPAGAPGCSLLVDPALFLGGFTDPNGAMDLRLTFPGGAHLVGQEVFTQFLVVDGPANALGMAFTNGNVAKIGN